MSPKVDPAVHAAVATTSQRHLWLFDRFYAHDGTYNIAFGIKVAGPLDPTAIRAALATVVARHDVLRTTFAEQDGELLQVIHPAVVLDVPVVELDTRGTELPGDVTTRIDEDAARPFDLARGPLLRATLYRNGTAESILAVVVHHIVCDGWSVEILLRELAIAYAAARDGATPDLPELPIQFGDFAEWHREQQRRPDASRDLEYWRQELANAPRQIDLLTDHPRRSETKRSGAMIRRPVDARLHGALRQLAQLERTSLFTLLIATFAALIGRYAGQRDLLIGMPVAGRTSEETEPLIGFFVKTVLIRVRRDHDDTFRRLLDRVGGTISSALRHQDTPIDDINAILAAGGASGTQPVLQVVCGSQASPAADLRFGGHPASIIWGHSGTAKYDLFLNVVEGRDSLSLDLEFDTGLFEAATARRVLESYELLLEALAADPSRVVDLVPIVGAGDRVVIDAANDTARPYPRDETVAHVFEAVAARTPDAAAILSPRGSTTFDALNRRANQLARALRRRGVEPGMPVGVACERSVDLVVALLGVLKAGAAYVPLDVSYPASRLEYMIADTGLRLVLTSGVQASELPPGPDVLALDAAGTDVFTGDDANPSVAGRPDDLAYVMYTSGSTGHPKGVAVPHRGIVRLVLGQSFVDWSLVTSVLHMAPIAFDASTFELWGPLLNGRPVAVFPGTSLDLDALQATLERHRVDCVWLTAALFNTIVDARPRLLHGVRQLLVGGEALSVPHVRKAFRDLPDTRIINGYGPTESTTFACCYPIPRPLPPDLASVPIGGPIANTTAFVIDDVGLETPVGVAGELYLGGDGLALGYLGRPSLSAERFVELALRGRAPIRTYRTGDRVRWLPNGTLEFLGRLDRQVKLRGFRIELDEVEHALAEAPGVGQAAVVMREDTPGDRRLVAYVARQSRQPVGALDVQRHLERLLPGYMVPAAVVVLDRLPETATGKIDRQRLPAPPQSTGDSAPDAQPATPLESDLAAIWREVLGLEAVGRHDNFFELGGHSLKAIDVSIRVQQRLGVELPFGRLLQHQTIASLASAIATDRHPDGVELGARAITPLRAAGSRPPIFFTHGVGGEVWSFAPLTRHLGDDQPVYGLLPLPHHQENAAGLSEMAARYIEEIRGIQPEGPYLLAGHCSGAAVAFEIAQQLTAAGSSVSLLAVLDYTFFDTGDRRPLSRLWQFVRNLPLWLTDDLFRVGWKTAAGRFESHLRVWLAEARGLFSRGGPATADIRDRLGMWRFPEHQAAALEQAYRTFQEYRPRAYAGNLVLITPRALPLTGVRQAADLGWRRLVKGELRIRQIRGSHETMLAEPFVAELSHVLRDEADRALEATAPRHGRP